MKAPPLLCGLAGLLLSLAAFNAPALTASGSFNVVVNLTTYDPPLARGTCVSEALSNQTQASVRVVCGTSQFVSVEAVPGLPYVGTHGGAYRYTFGPGAAPAPTSDGNAGLYSGTGTVTGMRIIDISGLESFVEMLVSF
ncbi:MAG: hypothetical protein ACKVOO_01820 [Burkholderiaceae bacterium]